ncbi:hypothetical protein NLJ89_g2577 [Agrocybe chaxingu]|uniref:Uncharacterized protein n=1 Tax=Agrocybe chaxingu TaxID=84603 RepID=A0A9W8MYU3_9AGAR|nr:hypothetical protein NLJ89_g2577 [Agrocybe chaxingu]
MTEGPPSWAASSSGSTDSPTTSKAPTPNPSTAASVPTIPFASNLSGPTPYSYTSWGAAWQPTYAAYSQGTQAASTTRFPSPAPPDAASKVYQQPTSQSQRYNPYTHLVQPTYNVNPTNGATSPPPAPQALKPTLTPPLPEPETYRHWDEVAVKFLRGMKMTQAVRGLEADILVLNPDWEQKALPDALKELVKGLQTILDRMDANQARDSMEVDGPVNMADNSNPRRRSLEDRKLDYIRLPNGMTPSSQSSFLARTRSRNDASNRAEFLHTLIEKKRVIFSDSTESPGSDDGLQVVEVSSCARVDARPIDRDKQIKYDIHNNAEGPLTRRAKVDTPANEQPTNLPIPALPNHKAPTEGDSRPQRKRKLGSAEEDRAPVTEFPSQSEGKRSMSVLEEGNGDQAITAERHPGLYERVRNVEAHLAMRYVPSPPRTLLARLKYIEDHIVKLEKEYPPWAALHFNQPNRGWPPPPRTTPVIVPPHLRSVTATPILADAGATLSTARGPGSAKPIAGLVVPGSASGTLVKQRNKDSSLRKAVLDRLEVQRAMSEMSGNGGQGS